MSIETMKTTMSPIRYDAHPGVLVEAEGGEMHGGRELAVFSLPVDNVEFRRLAEIASDGIHGSVTLGCPYKRGGPWRYIVDAYRSLPDHTRAQRRLVQTFDTYEAARAALLVWLPDAIAEVRAAELQAKRLLESKGRGDLFAEVTP